MAAFPILLTEKRVRLKGTASVIVQFRREVIGPLSVKP